MAEEISREHLMTLKATWLWNGASNGGKSVYGFSESWYTDLAPDLLFPVMLNVARSRARFMARGTYLYGYRVADTAPNSRAFTQIERDTVSIGRTNGYPNVPQDAVLCAVNGTVAGTRKRFWFHNLPDDAVEDSGLVAASDIESKARDTINLLQQNGFKFRYAVQTAPTGRILSIDANGNVLTAEPIAGIAIRNVVQLLKVRGTDGRGKRGKFYVDAVTSDFSFRLAHWPGDVVAASGKIRLVQYLYTSLVQIPATGLTSDPTIRPGVRKCGRPFGQLRGRAVARR